MILRMKTLRYFTLNMLISISVIAGDFTTKCPRPCNCKWQSGNKAADCSGGHLTTVPDKLSSEIQNLDLSKNPLGEITQHAFEQVALSNLKKLILKDCNIRTIHKRGLNNLRIMIELDISANDITQLHPDSFRETEKLRWINFSNNKLEVLSDGLFANLQYLQKVEASDNKISLIGSKTFVNLPRMQILRLDGNNLVHMNVETLSSLLTLSSLDLHNNPWKCDCNLQSFRNWVIKRNLYTPPTSCMKPKLVANKLWNELDSTEFACKPSILYPPSNMDMKTGEANATFPCKVVGNPTPNVFWLYNNQVVDGNSKKLGEHKYFITHTITNMIQWVNLTVMNVKYHDKGVYTCVGKNPGGSEERNVTLVISASAGILGQNNMGKSILPILTGSFTGVLVLFVLTAVFIYVFCYKSKRKKPIIQELQSPSDDDKSKDSNYKLDKLSPKATETGTKSIQNELSQSTPINNSTGNSDSNKTLLLHDYNYVAEDVGVSHEIERTPSSSDRLSTSEYFQQELRIYPPDLLTFPLPNNSHVSPTYAAQMVEQIGKHSPRQPSSQSYIGQFGTLPYSKSQTQFHAAYRPKYISHQAYVTLPRRPKTYSWSDFTALDGSRPYTQPRIERVYLGNRGINSDNGSGLKFNTSAILNPYGSFRGTYVPIYKTSETVEIPTSHEYRDPAPSPAPSTPYLSSLRNSISSPYIHQQIKILQEEFKSSLRNAAQDDKPDLKVNWSKTGDVENKSPKPSEFRKHTVSDKFMLNETKVLINSGTELRKKYKCPPSVPPKPRKKIVTDSKEYLFSSEAEGHTEV